MSYTIEDRVEGERGCGYRKPGGLYLISGGPAVACGKLPIPLSVCPCCGNGIKPTRGWTWVNGTALAAEKVCDRDPGVFHSGCITHPCFGCPLAAPMGRVGLLWIGEAFYKTPEDFCRESQEMGLSRRISAVPRDFVLGATWVWLAHRKTIKTSDGTFTPGVFRVFKPERIEYVVKGDESEDELQRMTDRGLTLVRVHRANQTQPMFSGADRPLRDGV
jgi:hypothetical protein